MSSLEEIMAVKSPYRSSPVRNSCGPENIANVQLTKFLSKVEEWKTLKVKSLSIVRAIQSLKLHEIIGEDFPKQLTPLSESLVETGKMLKLIVEDLTTISKQMNVLLKLYSSTDHVINTWSIEKVASHIREICDMFEKELSLKQTVIENICHTREESLTEVYVSSWDYDVFVDFSLVDVLEAELHCAPNANAASPTKGIKSP